MLCGIFLNFLLLFVCKYFVWIVNILLGIMYNTGIISFSIELKPVSLPLGISFFTFQAISYLIDVYRNNSIVCQKLYDFTCYLTMFPQLVAGPIIRYEEIAPELRHWKVSSEQLYSGICRFIIGLGKKVLIANPVAAIADMGFGSFAGNELSYTVAWFILWAYTLQIYFDFSGYSDMAIGLGQMFGFRFPENFKHPYGALSLRDFWRRWHMTLSGWLRDYVYIPLGGSRTSSRRTMLNLLIVFALCGLWHGAAFTFLLWGIWNGIFLIFERTRYGQRVQQLPAMCRLVYTWGIFMLGWVLFRAESLPHAIEFYKSLFGFSGGELSIASISFPWALPLMIIFTVASTGFFSRHYDISAFLSRGSKISVSINECIKTIFYICCFLGSVFMLIISSYNPFIYFRF